MAGRGEGKRALDNVRGPDRLQECTTARPARPTAPAGRAPRLGSWEATLEMWSPPDTSRAHRLPYLPDLGRAGAVVRARAHSDTRARNRPPGRRARAARALGHVAARAPPSPRSTPFLSIWVSFFPFFLLLFFSMNTHRVHLKATRPHFTASVGFLLPRVPLQFNTIFKKEKANLLK